MESRRLKNLQTNIELLGPNEHGVLLDMLTSGGVHCDRNANGFFCDLVTLDDPLLTQIEEFVRYSIENNEKLDDHDRCMHDTLLLLQRIPPVASDSKAGINKRFVPRDVIKADAGFSNKGAKLAFYKRASDAPSRKKGDEIVVEPDAPLYVTSASQKSAGVCKQG